MMQGPESFERFYNTKVALGDVCGCAKRVIDVYQFNRKAGQSSSWAAQPAVAEILGSEIRVAESR
jgi:hypothetical protein